MVVRRNTAHQLLIASAIVGSLAWHSAAIAQNDPADAASAGKGSADATQDAAVQPGAAQVPAAPSAPSGVAGNGAATVDNEAVTSNDIIVTATRTTQRLENVPASIIAVTGSALQTAGVTKFQDLALVAPGVQISRSGTYT